MKKKFKICQHPRRKYRYDIVGYKKKPTKSGETVPLRSPEQFKKKLIIILTRFLILLIILLFLLLFLISNSKISMTVCVFRKTVECRNQNEKA